MLLKQGSKQPPLLVIWNITSWKSFSSLKVKISTCITCEMLYNNGSIIIWYFYRQVHGLCTYWIYSSVDIFKWRSVQLRLLWQDSASSQTIQFSIFCCCILFDSRNGLLLCVSFLLVPFSASVRQGWPSSGVFIHLLVLTSCFVTCIVDVGLFSWGQFLKVCRISCDCLFSSLNSFLSSVSLGDCEWRGEVRHGPFGRILHVL